MSYCLQLLNVCVLRGFALLLLKRSELLRFGVQHGHDRRHVAAGAFGLPSPSWPRLGIMESFRSKMSQLCSAAEAAEMIIRVDDIIKRPAQGIDVFVCINIKIIYIVLQFYKLNIES